MFTEKFFEGYKYRLLGLKYINKSWEIDRVGRRGLRRFGWVLIVFIIFFYYIYIKFGYKYIY